MANKSNFGFLVECRICVGLLIPCVFTFVALFVYFSQFIQCNGFSAGVNPDDFRGPGFKTGYDPVWIDLLTKHNEQPFHALVGGGDQLYCDVYALSVQCVSNELRFDFSLMREPEMQEWVSLAKPEDKKSFMVSPEMELSIDRFFFNHYCQAFRRGAFARANCSM